MEGLDAITDVIPEDFILFHKKSVSVSEALADLAFGSIFNRKGIDFVKPVAVVNPSQKKVIQNNQVKINPQSFHQSRLAGY